MNSRTKSVMPETDDAEHDHDSTQFLIKQQRCRHADKQTDTQADTQTNRQTDKQTDRHPDRQTSRQTDRHPFCTKQHRTVDGRTHKCGQD